MHCFNTRQPKVCRHASHQCYNRVTRIKGSEGRGSRTRELRMVGCKTGTSFMVCIYNLEFTIAITAASAFDNTSSRMETHSWPPTSSHASFQVNVHVYVSICAQPTLSITFDESFLKFYIRYNNYSLFQETVT